jgi:CheY-like chemotaxis protein
MVQRFIFSYRWLVEASMSRSEGEIPLGSEAGRLTREHGHALRNIFSTILANAAMVCEELEATGQVHRRLERIMEACHRGEELVHHIRRSGSAQAPSGQPQIGEVPPGRAMPSGCVLVVDDEKDIVAIISRYLNKDGLDVHGMTDSRLALKRVRANPFAFDLLLTDCDMPFLSGPALCRGVHEVRPDLPVLMVTGYDRHISPEQLSDLGVGELLTKPLNRQALLAAVRRLLTP